MDKKGEVKLSEEQKQEKIKKYREYLSVILEKQVNWGKGDDFKILSKIGYVKGEKGGKKYDRGILESVDRKQLDAGNVTDYVDKINMRN